MISVMKAELQSHDVPPPSLEPTTLKNQLFRGWKRPGVEPGAEKLWNVEANPSVSLKNKQHNLEFDPVVDRQPMEARRALVLLSLSPGSRYESSKNPSQVHSQSTKSCLAFTQNELITAQSLWSGGSGVISTVGPVYSSSLTVTERSTASSSSPPVTLN